MGANPFHVAVLDFNGDGNQDLVLGNGTVLLGNGTGGFMPTAGFPPGSIFLVADFNGDGRPDVGISTAQGLVVMLRNPDNTFTAAPGSPVPGTSGNQIAVADFNNDGKVDLAVLNIQGVTILFGDGRGGFSPAPAGTTPVRFSGFGGGVAIGDFNQDGKADLAISTFSIDTAGISVLLGDGNGGFTVSQSISLGFVTVSALLTGDVNLDGRTDLMVVQHTFGSSSPVGSFRVLLGNGNGMFTPGPGQLFGSSPAAGVLADFNKDGKPDLAITDFLTGNTGVLLNDGTGVFTHAPGSPFPSGFNPTHIAVGDFNNDGRPDMAIVVNGVQKVTVLLNALTPVSVAPPFGFIDTPVNGSSGQAGAINFTGWALSPVTVAKVSLCREPVTGESSNAIDPRCLLNSSPTGLVYLADAVLVPGVRPDVAITIPGYPHNNWGWGAQILTNFLPGTNGLPMGNGTYKLHAIAADPNGLSTDLGATTMSVNNAASVLPFGTIDTPRQGETISGAGYVNFGWVLAPQPNIVPIDGSSITVHIDGVAVGHPVYNQYRSDIATLFPGLKNSSGGVGYFVIDTTKLSNGIHSIDWVGIDTAGHSAGVGSRNFFVQN